MSPIRCALPLLSLLVVCACVVYATTTQDNPELAALRRDLDDIREEMKSHTSCNERRNSQLTLEWAMRAVGELKREMREVEAAANATGWQHELRNEVAAMLAEAEGVTKLAAKDGARLAAEEARHAELILDMRQVRQMATDAARSCDDLKDQLNKAKGDWKMALKMVNKKMNLNYDPEVYSKRTADDTKYGYRRLRHLHSLHRQLHDMKTMYHSMQETQTSLGDEVRSLRVELEAALHGRESPRLERLAETQRKHSDTLANVTIEIGNFNKMHTSMLELLENVEKLESKVDKAIPDIQREISKLEVDTVQLHSQSEYLKDDRESVHRSVKAIAVSVSNLMDKVDADRAILVRLNETTEPTSCDDVDGVRSNVRIHPRGGNASVVTSCREGWTLVQRRTDGAVDFNRTFSQYENSFGDPDGEYWLGNAALHGLTAGNCSTLRIDLVDNVGRKWTAEYDHFAVGPASSGYKLSVGGYKGNAGDAMAYHHGSEFSTVDRDRDGTAHTNCAADYEGGWWYAFCQCVNINGKYSLGLTWFHAGQNRWIEVAASDMYVRENAACR